MPAWNLGEGNPVGEEVVEGKVGPVEHVHGGLELHVGIGPGAEYVHVLVADHVGADLHRAGIAVVAHLDQLPAPAHEVEPFCEGGRGARRLDHHVGAHPVRPGENLLLPPGGRGL